MLLYGANISAKLNVESLKKYFGVFLGTIAIYEIYTLIKEYKKSKKTDNIKENKKWEGDRK